MIEAGGEMAVAVPAALGTGAEMLSDAIAIGTEAFSEGWQGVKSAIEKARSVYLWQSVGELTMKLPEGPFHSDWQGKPLTDDEEGGIRGHVSKTPDKTVVNVWRTAFPIPNKLYTQIVLQHDEQRGRVTGLHSYEYNNSWIDDFRFGTKRGVKATAYRIEEWKDQSDHGILPLDRVVRALQLATIATGANQTRQERREEKQRMQNEEHVADIVNSLRRFNRENGKETYSSKTRTKGAINVLYTRVVDDESGDRDTFALVEVYKLPRSGMLESFGKTAVTVVDGQVTEVAYGQYTSPYEEIEMAPLEGTASNEALAKVVRNLSYKVVKDLATR